MYGSACPGTVCFFFHPHSFTCVCVLLPFLVAGARRPACAAAQDDHVPHRRGGAHRRVGDGYEAHRRGAEAISRCIDMVYRFIIHLSIYLSICSIYLHKQTHTRVIYVYIYIYIYLEGALTGESETVMKHTPG